MVDTPAPIHRHHGTIMGGPWQILHRPAAQTPPSDVAAAAFAALQAVDRQMSTYRADSELMLLNAAPLHTFVPISGELATVMQCADRLAELSKGAFNICLGEMVNAWGFGPNPAPLVPVDKQRTAEQASAVARGNYTLRTDPPALRKNAPCAFDLCAIAKGFAVDQAAKSVRGLGVDDFLIEASGEVYASGEQAHGKPWRVGLELPVPGDDHVVFDEVKLEGMGVATSGGYRNLRTIDAKTYSHIVDPTTGAPLETTLLSVTVAAHTCMEADGLATALYVLGGKAGIEFAHAHKIAALFMLRETEGFREVRTDAFWDLARF
ncbi:thiamine biosynthesis lipoprotein [Yoonia tamlensis]|uniref:FAD:protein FMN transferase n=1 Tax=Yoonia tamlensis TaxID=390270 RepID=A0A1I6GZP6_9RHOB|nr:FAD:protein FMN transferase [Yoonia tamlensis]SFR47676.1 thiamine biosynthesis lipoprotein [Yoonia tamlensis]